MNFNDTAIPGSNNAGDPKQIVSTLADVDPMSLDRSIKFSHVGGLESHIRCLKEMVVFPMMYREVFEKFHIQPPKGVLFHGPPGKWTLVSLIVMSGDDNEIFNVSKFL